ncbi:MAG: futalosine hydrolase [Bacteroidetes bacterium]|nr:futalosine hydrolase [Bacteroidota bacterium]
MRILLVSATMAEIRPLLVKQCFLGEENDYLFNYQSQQNLVDVLLPGIGMMQTAFHLGKQFGNMQYDLAINAGIAGAYTDSLKIGEVVNITEECITELGAEDGDNLLSLFELGLMDPDATPYKGGRLVNETAILINAIAKLRTVKGATANTIHGNIHSIMKIKSLFNADVESMEGAAFLFSCLSSKIPCYQIRSISNYVEERDKTRWNIELAVKNLNKILEEVLNELVISH